MFSVLINQLAFLLPMFRHIMDQPELESGDGPIGLILAPTRELAIQIGAEARRFCKHIGLTCVCCYGGIGVADQIAQLKTGAELVIASLPTIEEARKWIDEKSSDNAGSFAFRDGHRLA